LRLALSFLDTEFRPVLCFRLNTGSIKLSTVSDFGAVSTTVLIGDFLSGCLVLFASLFMVFDVSLDIESQEKGKK
jgi:hypothetical protein